MCPRSTVKSKTAARLPDKQIAALIKRVKLAGQVPASFIVESVVVSCKVRCSDAPPLESRSPLLLIAATWGFAARFANGLRRKSLSVSTRAGPAELVIFPH
jgi:hypothetical protein